MFAEKSDELLIIYFQNWNKNRKKQIGRDRRAE